MKNWKIFYEAQTQQRSALRKLFNLSPLQPDKNLITSLEQKFSYGDIATEIYRHLLSKCFKNAVLGPQEMVECKCFFWHQTKKCLLEKLRSGKRFWLCWRSILFSVSSELRFVKSVRFSWAKLYCKMSNLFH